MGKSRTSLVFQWLRLCTSNVENAGLIPSQESKIPHASWHDQKINNLKKKFLVKKKGESLNKDFTSEDILKVNMHTKSCSTSLVTMEM